MTIDSLLSPRAEFWFCVTLLLSTYIALIIYAYLAYRRLEYMERLLDKCSFIAFHSRFWDNSPRGRMMRLNAVAVAVLLPKRFLKRGLIDWQQVQEFPRGFKYVFRGMFFFSVIFFICIGIILLCK